MQAKSRIFISHSSHDSALAGDLVIFLESQGLHCWIAPRDIVGGTNWAAAIFKGLEECGILILLLSEKANISQQVLREIQLADNSKKPILPVRIDNCELSGEMKYYLSVSHWLSLSASPGSQDFFSIMAACKVLLNCQGQEKEIEGTPSAAVPLSGPVPRNREMPNQQPQRLSDNNAHIHKVQAGNDFPWYDAKLARLMDTSVDNPLIAYPLSENFKTNTIRSDSCCIQLLVPDLAKFEDKLMSGENLICKGFQFEDEQKAGIIKRYLLLDEATTAGIHNYFQKFLDQGYIPVYMPPGELENRINRINLRINKNINSSGAADFYLGLGLLRWTDGQKSFLAPLFLYPARLEMRGEDISLLLGTGDPYPNYPLLEKFAISDAKTDWSFLREPPKDQAGLDIPEILRRAKSITDNRLGWFIHERVVLDFFPFSKALAWRDLKANRQQWLQHPIIAGIGRQKAVPVKVPAPFPTPEKLEQEDTELAEQLLICNADSVQQSAVIAAHREHSFVIESSPGSGKTSTIANIIASRIYDGKNVLYIASSAASRRKVFDCLKKAGLETSVLCFAAENENGNRMSQEILSAKNEAACARPANFDQVHARWLNDRAALQAYFRAIYQVTPLGKSFYELANMLLEYRLQQIPLLTLSYAEPCRYSADWLNSQVALLKEISNVAASLKDFALHPFRGCASENIQESFLPKFPVMIRTLLDKTRCIQDRLAQQSPGKKSLGDFLRGFTAAASPDAPDKTDSLEKRILALPSIRQVLGRLDEGLRYWRQWQDNLKGVQKFFKVDLVSQPDLVKLLRWAENQRGVLNRFLGTLISVPERERLLEFSISAELPDNEELLKALQFAVKAHDLKQRLALWSSQNQDLIETMGRPAEWARLNRIFPALQKLAEKNHTGSSRSDKLTITALQADLQGLINEFRTLRDELFSALGFDSPENFGCAADDIAWETLEQRLICWESNHQRLREWGSVNRACEKVRQNETTRPFLSEIQAGRLQPSLAARAFVRSFLECWILAWIDENPVLRNFSRFEHDQCRAQFVQNSRKLIDDGLFAQLIRAKIFEHREKIKYERWYEQEKSLLERETRKIAGHLPVKNLFSSIRNLALGYKPCMIMTPKLVEEFLPAESELFDTLIIDQGSHTVTHRALGIISRARQLIAIGNPVYKTGIAEPGSENEDNFDEIDSLLDECAAILPNLKLQWHYRSPEESPISFLNQKFHKSQLKAFPGACSHLENSGVSLVPVTGSDNCTEAISNWLSKNSKQFKKSGRTIGIITLSQNHCETIRGELVKKRLSEEVEAKNSLGGQTGFINLTTIDSISDFQHDLLILALNLPKNNSTVEMDFSGQRFNVGFLYKALANAKEQLIVFSNLKSSDSYPDTFSGNSLKNLIAGLEDKITSPADTRPLPGMLSDMLARLKHTQLSLETNKGCGEYCIDIALKEKDQYLLAVETDGFSYATGATVLERDLIRPSILENFGWQCHHVWLIEWLRNPDGELQLMYELLERSRIELAETSADNNVAVEKTSSGSKKSANQYLANKIKQKESGRTLILSSLGRAYWLNGYELPDGSQMLYGGSIIDLLKLPENEKLIATIDLNGVNDNCRLAMVTLTGMIKTTPALFEEKTKNGMTLINLEKGDEIVDACLVRTGDHIVIASRSGNAIRFPESEVSPKGPGAKAMKGINIGESNDTAVSITSFSPVTPIASALETHCADENDASEDNVSEKDLENEVEFAGMLMTVSEKGFAKKTGINEYKPMHRNCKGVENFNIGRRTGKVLAARRVLDGDQIVLITAAGNVVCHDAENILSTSRVAQGNRMLDLEKTDRVVSVIVIPQSFARGVEI
ncbi:hypothetical protein MASR1M12_37210 [Erysipelotrichia bacterium]